MRTGTVFMERPVVNGVVTVFTNGLALFEEFDMNIPLRRSRLSGKMETTCPDRRKPL
ncbi:MAG: hypothetical protein ACLUAR_09550 [Pilosibacter sp.]